MPTTDIGAPGNSTTMPRILNQAAAPASAELGLPGDLVIQRPNVTVYFPLGMMILVSLVLTFLLNLLLRR